MLFKKGDKVPYKPRPYQQTKEFLARLKKQGFQKGSKVNLGRKMKPSQGFQKGEKHWNWKDDEVGYGGVHIRIETILGKPKKCEHCGTTTAKMYDWANKDHTYKMNLEDWMRLCRKCHMKYDKEHNNRLTHHK